VGSGDRRRRCSVGVVDDCDLQAVLALGSALWGVDKGKVDGMTTGDPTIGDWLRGCLCVFLLAMLLNSIGQRLYAGRLRKAMKYKPPNIHGAADWASEKELKKAGLFKKTGLPLGYSSKSGKPICFPGTTHLICFGGTGSGKTTQALIPAALSWEDSAVFL